MQAVIDPRTERNYEHQTSCGTNVARYFLAFLGLSSAESPDHGYDLYTDAGREEWRRNQNRRLGYEHVGSGDRDPEGFGV